MHAHTHTWTVGEPLAHVYTCVQTSTCKHTSVRTRAHMYAVTHAHTPCSFRRGALQLPRAHTAPLKPRLGTLSRWASCSPTHGAHACWPPCPAPHPHRSLPTSSQIDLHTPNSSQCRAIWPLWPLLPNSFQNHLVNTRCLQILAQTLLLPVLIKNPKELLFMWVTCVNIFHSRN